MSARAIVEALLPIPAAYRGHLGGVNPYGQFAAQSVDNVIETDHSEVGNLRWRWRWAQGASDTVMWSVSSEERSDPDFEAFTSQVSAWIEEREETAITRDRFFPEGYSTWRARVQQAAGKS